jgi:hypothetical protein
MDMRGRRLIVPLAIGLLLATAGCGTVPAPPSGMVVPDLRGTWTGTWGGQPMTLLIRDQQDPGGDGGVYLGSWQVLGDTRPAVSGVLTFTLRESSISTGMHGRLGYAGGVTLRIEANPADGRQELMLKHRDGRLSGDGTSAFPWGPQGAIELTSKRGG